MSCYVGAVFVDQMPKETSRSLPSGCQEEGEEGPNWEGEVVKENSGD
ncbi:hypothetical protein PPTG_22438 [Phytophthora nicotianae INRA-310]|uniref:Uncharacterized protein n=2 Tax=Phytophthora nicotianae TaxID=4792 RepID=W2QJ95_PHYN3|nr:hypothetical protein PPTG_22438 [Phytophthora nicotianae INRA-310]ETN12976.1 hypothetical protein PPTG_22438 [Phytophthora nicotianae INRA-310]ETO80879.1 hypothetical protein F444_04718 [Phytophthora nicotianae P1976]